VLVQYLRNCWYMVGWARDFEVGKLMPLVVLNERLVIYRSASNRLVALEDRCPHRLAPLSAGRLEQDDIRCMYHGLKFAPDGRCVQIPGQTKIPPTVSARSFAIEEKHSVAWVWMGEKAKADTSLIPDFVGIEHPDWRMLPGQMDYDANYTLINANLLDLSHVPYVHRNSFGGGEEMVPEAGAAFEMAVPTIETLDRGLRMTTAQRAAPTVPLFREEVGPVVDTWTTNDFLVPGIFLLTMELYAPGTIDRAGGRRPTETPLHRNFSCQAVLPITDRRSRYFYALGPWPQSKLNADVFAQVAQMAFAEDKAMINAQQQVIDGSPGVRPKLLFMDKMNSKFDSIMRRLLAVEMGESASSAELATAALVGQMDAAERETTV
jgi:nitrite reductase/ring-hydroxylating ferredoxin subunit